MKNVIKLITNRVACRDFEREYEMKPSDIDAIIQAARQAPNWSNGQAYSIIILQGEEKNAFVKALRQSENYSEIFSGQLKIIKNASVYMVFCADLYRASKIAGEGFNIVNDLEPLLITTTDCALALQSAETATQALGLGGVIQGVTRFFGNAVCDSLTLPAYTFPLLGFAIGKPARVTPAKPRLDSRIAVFEGRYKTSEQTENYLRHYDEEIKKCLMVLFGDGRSWFETTRTFYAEKHYPEAETMSVLTRQGFIR